MSEFLEVTVASGFGHGCDGVVIDFPKNMAVLKWVHPDHGVIIRAEVRDDKGNVLEASPDIVAAESGGMKMAFALALCFVPTFPFAEATDTMDMPLVLHADGKVKRQMIPNYDQDRSRFLIAKKPLRPTTPPDMPVYTTSLEQVQASARRILQRQAEADAVAETQPLSPELQAKAIAMDHIEPFKVFQPAGSTAADLRAKAAGSPKLFPFPLPYSSEGVPGQVRKLAHGHKCAGCEERGAKPTGEVFWASLGWLCTACNNNGGWTDAMLEPVPVPPAVEPATVPVTESPAAEPVLKHLIVFGALLPDPMWAIADAQLVEATNAYIIRRDNPIQSCRVAHTAMLGTRDEIVKNITEKLDKAIETFTKNAIPARQAAHTALQHKPSNMNYPMSRLP